MPGGVNGHCHRGSKAVADFAGDDEVTMSEQLLKDTGEQGDLSGSSYIGETVREGEGPGFVVLPGEKNVESKRMKNHQTFCEVT